jgi:hypothetical protein
LQILEKQREQKIKYGRFNPSLNSAKKRVVVSKLEMNEYDSIILPKLNNPEKYNTIEVEAVYDRSKSVDPTKKIK